MNSSDSQLELKPSSSLFLTQRRSSVFREFLRSPLQTGALFASGPQLASKLVHFANVRSSTSIVEIGAGSGAVTDEIVKHKSRDASLLAIEINEWLATLLRTRHPEIDVQCGDALEASQYLKQLGYGNCDAVVCSLPWANMSRQQQSKMLDVIETLLQNGGHFTSFAYAHCRFLPNARFFRQQLMERFDSVTVSEIQWANIPPAYIYHAEVIS